jgi:signal peptidase I
MGIQDNIDDPNRNQVNQVSNTEYQMSLTDGDVASLKMMQGVTSVEPIVNSGDESIILFPYVAAYNWSEDDYGPMWIPKKGATIQLTPDNIIRYKRCILVYEGNKFEERNGRYFVNDEPATSYTFQMNYYWLMGDNRHNSLDSRFWGFLDHS